MAVQIRFSYGNCLMFFEFADAACIVTASIATVQVVRQTLRHSTLLGFTVKKCTAPEAMVTQVVIAPAHRNRKFFSVSQRLKNEDLKMYSPGSTTKHHYLCSGVTAGIKAGFH